MMICVILEPSFSFHFLLSLEFANLQKTKKLKFKLKIVKVRAIKRNKQKTTSIFNSKV